MVGCLEGVSAKREAPAPVPEPLQAHPPVKALETGSDAGALGLISEGVGSPGGRDSPSRAEQVWHAHVSGFTKAPSSPLELML